MSHPFVPERVDLYAHYIVKRREAQTNRAAGRPKPWTDDPIIQTGRLTNVEREDDAVTLAYARAWPEPHADDPDAWFASAVWRLVNRRETGDVLAYPVPWDPEHFVSAMVAQPPGKRYGGAYTIPGGPKGVPKHVYQARDVLGPMWGARERIRSRQGDMLASFFARLVRCNGFGSFYVGQVIADIKYIEPLKNAADWSTWATPGPGSGPGMNWLLGATREQKWTKSEAEWHRLLTLLIAEVAPRLAAAGIGPLHAQDHQNNLCEFNKYCKEKYLGEKVRRRFNGLPDVKTKKKAALPDDPGQIDLIEWMMQQEPGQ